MNEQKLKEIEARCNAAAETWTLTSWRAGQTGSHAVCDEEQVLFEQPEDTINPSPDLVFAAHARSDVPALIAALREAWQELAAQKPKTSYNAFIDAALIHNEKSER